MGLITIRKCPLDGGKVKDEGLDEFCVCQTCREILSAAELVDQHSKATALAYVRAHGYEDYAEYRDAIDRAPRNLMGEMKARLAHRLRGQ